MILRAIILACVVVCARAEVVRVEILGRVPLADGKSYGADERIKGRLYLETDPRNAANARISDFQRAPRNARGQVETWTCRRVFYLGGAKS